MWYASVTSARFYTDELKDSYVAAGTWPSDAIALTDAEYTTLYAGVNNGQVMVLAADGAVTLETAPAPSIEALASDARYERDLQLQESQWLVDRHRDQTEAGIATTLTTDQYSALLIYRQALRDWPTVADFPADSTKPAAPDWLAAAEAETA